VDFSTAWPLPYELTLEIALILAHWHVDELFFKTTPSLHKFRLACKTFGTIGKQAVTIFADTRPLSGYSTLCLPPRKLPMKHLVEMFAADGGTLAKLIRTISIVLMPSDFSGPTNNDREALKIPTLDDQERYSPKTICIDNGWSSFLTSFPNIIHLHVDTIVLPGRGRTYNFESAWALVRSVTHSVDVKWLTLENCSPDDWEAEEDGPSAQPAGYRQAWQDPAEKIVENLVITRLSRLALYVIYSCTGGLDSLLVAILTKAHSLKYLALYTDDEYNFEPDVLSAVSEAAELESLTLLDFAITTEDEKALFLHFLLARRATLRMLELEMYVHAETLLWEFVTALRNKFTLNFCEIRVTVFKGDTGEDIMPQLRSVIRRFGGPDLAIKDDEYIRKRHGLALDRYILGQPALAT